MSGTKTHRTPGLEGTKLLAVFLFLTLGLSVWLGYQALDAARSHRRTAEGVLTDFAAIAVWDYSRRIQENLAYMARRIFDDVPQRLRRLPPDPEVMENDLRYALRGQDCRCEGLRENSWFFRVDLRNSSVVMHHDQADGNLDQALARELVCQHRTQPDLQDGLLSVPEGSGWPHPSLVFYTLSGDGRQDAIYAYGMVSRAQDLEELFGVWLDSAPVLPMSLVSHQPSDSLMEM